MRFGCGDRERVRGHGPGAGRVRRTAALVALDTGYPFALRVELLEYPALDTGFAVKAHRMGR